MSTKVGECKKCGAPMYMPMVWSDSKTPPVEKTCNCFPDYIINQTPNTGYVHVIDMYKDLRNQTIRQCVGAFENTDHENWKAHEIVDILQAMITE